MKALKDTVAGLAKNRRNDTEKQATALSDAKNAKDIAQEASKNAEKSGESAAKEAKETKGKGIQG